MYFLIQFILMIFENIEVGFTHVLLPVKERPIREKVYPERDILFMRDE